MQTNSVEEIRQWLADFDAAHSSCPVERRQYEIARAEQQRHQKIINMAEAHAREQRVAIDKREGSERFVDGRIERQLDFHFGHVQDGEIVGGVLYEALGQVIEDERERAPVTKTFAIGNLLTNAFSSAAMRCSKS